MIRLKDTNKFPNKWQYIIDVKAREGLQKVITIFVGHGLLVPCNSHCYTPTLPVRKKDGTYGLVQDLQAINEAVIPIHPIVPNPYTILGKLPFKLSGSQY